MRPRLLLVDDHPTFLAFARKLFGMGNFEVVGDANDAASARDAVRELRPDLVLLDVQLGEDDGIALAHELATADPAPVVILISARAAVDYGERLDQAPIAGFVGKTDLTPDAVTSLLR
jgi:DNA-binding NarL/FixJ family response regulator